MKRITSLLLLSLSGLVFINCEESSSPNSPIRFPTTEDAYWIYSVVQLDSAGNAITATLLYDSAVVIGPAVIQGREAIQINHYYSNDSVWRQYIRTLEDRLEQYLDLSGDIPVGLGLPLSTWVTVADFQRTGWTALDTTIEDFVLTIPHLGAATFSGTVTIHGRRSGTEKMVIQQKTYTAAVFTLKRLIELTVQLTLDGNPVSSKLQITIPTRLWFVDNVGIVQWESPSISVRIDNLPTIGTLSLGTIIGHRATLIRFSIPA